jgi:hypothetical protein
MNPKKPAASKGIATTLVGNPDALKLTLKHLGRFAVG